MDVKLMMMMMMNQCEVESLMKFSPHPSIYTALIQLVWIFTSQDLDLTKHRLVFDGPLVWRITSQKSIYLHVVLLEDALVLLQKQDDKLVLRFQSTLITAGKEDTRYTHSPIMRVSEVLVKSVANGEDSTFHQYITIF